MLKGYELGVKIKYQNHLYQTLIAKDKKIGFLKIVDNGYEMPSALEILRLNSLINPNNIFKFI